MWAPRAPTSPAGFIWFVSGVCMRLGVKGELGRPTKLESPGPQGLAAIGGDSDHRFASGLETGLTLSRREESKPPCGAHVSQALGGLGRSWGWGGREALIGPPPGQHPLLRKGPRKEGPISQPRESMCLIKIHKNVLG